MASGDKELEKQLREAGDLLLKHPSSVDELLPLLDQVENCLSRVEQSPRDPMLNALSPSRNALVEDELLRHSDVDVKVAVASCISEITRITAPDAPYEDEKMKDIFQLIVSSFENLSDKSSRSYNKRASILETVAKVRSCVVMLDLECDELIVAMFQHFLEAIRDYHPENVFASMETIMTLVVEESEEISLALLTPLLATVQRDNEEKLPIARKLGEKVIQNCAVKLKPYLAHAVKSLGVPLKNYSEVVASICEETTSSIENNDDNAIGEQQGDAAKVTKDAKEIVADQPCPEEVDPAVDKSPKSVMSNGIAETQNEGTSLNPEYPKKLDLGNPESPKKSVPAIAESPKKSDPANESLNVALTNKADTDDSDDGKLVKPESKAELISKRRGKKPTSSISSAEALDSSRTESEEVTEKVPDEDLSEAAVASENEKELDVQLSSPKAVDSDAVNLASPSPSGSLPDESQTKKKETLIKEDAPSIDLSIKLSSEVKRQKRSGKKAPAGVTKEHKISFGTGTTRDDAGTTSDSEVKKLRQSGKKGGTSETEVKPLRQSGKKGDGSDADAKTLKQSGKKGEASNDSEDKSSIKMKEDGKRRGRGKDTVEKDVKNSSTKDEVKASEAKEHGEKLVGQKIKVWWPKDHEFYEGVVGSFDSTKNKHQVLYVDGDEETLDLKKERWELLGDNSVSDGEQNEDRSPDGSPGTHKKKKAKTNFDSLVKQDKKEVSLKGSGAAASGKSKGTAKKSGSKSMDEGKFDSKAKDNTPKSSGKSKDRFRKSGGESAEDVPRAAGKSKDDDAATVKASAKSKQETPQTVNKSKGKSPSSGSKANANGTGKVKSGSSKVKESENLKGKTKAPESVKRKSPDSAKARESGAKASGAKSGKKRRRS
ncbi:hypothetical protein RJ640_013088 [Escallonia rubra]|uniref:Tudor domain-containing protein n=1 Tax=Escallonia rubra TaxID=112253 RepID=A0AA88UEM2_9ASTE|nr:hypothetical protein RJ640_013088 [Escallonia rubra]